jgi:hypothetical protein
VEILNMIYPSIGPSGAEGQRFLLYQHKPMWQAASEFVPLLDVPEQAEAPAADPADPKEAFKTGVGLYYRLKRPGQPTDFEGFKRCIRLMGSVQKSDQSTGQLRWGASMLAARIASEVLSEFDQARTYYMLAQNRALPNSVEAMIAGYALADVYVHQGDRSQASRQAQDLVKKFAAHRDSHVYQRAAAIAQAR